MFNRKPKPVQERVEALKAGPGSEYYALSLQDDLAQLIGEGLEKTGMTQRELAKVAGYRNESYISRLANAGTNFKIGVVARVLVAMGIIPAIVDKAELDRLREVERRSTANGIHARNASTADRIIFRASATGTVTSTASGSSGVADIVGGSCPVCPEQVRIYRGGSVRMPVVLPQT